MNDVQFELMLTIALVVMVIFLFLRNVAATIIPSVAVPLSLVGTFGVMYLLGYSLNNLTLMALTISTGFVVDDAIVMIENISRYIEEGEDPLDAALKGSEQIGFTIVSLTVSLIAVLIPLLFMGDIVGRLFREFAITLAVTILVSAVVSLTLTPMMCARLLQHKPGVSRARFYRMSERFFKSVIALLRPHAAIRSALPLHHADGHHRHPGADHGPLRHRSEGLFPGPGYRRHPRHLRSPQSVSFQSYGQRQQELADVILKDPDVESLSSFIGIDGTTRPSTAAAFRSISNRSNNATTASWISFAGCKPELKSVEGITLYLQPVQDLTVDDVVSRTQYQYSLEDADATELDTWTYKLVERAAQALRTHRRRQRSCRTRGLRTDLVIDRDTRIAHGRARCPPSTTCFTMPSASARSPPCSRSSTSTT